MNGMGFEKGHKKSGGRVKGTSNKITKELRVLLKDLMYEELSKIPEHLSSLEPKDKIDLRIKLMPYVLPKVKSVRPSDGEPINLSVW